MTDLPAEGRHHVHIGNERCFYYGKWTQGKCGKTGKTMSAEEVTDLVGQGRIKFWDCPENHLREPKRVRIVWVGDLATCQDCGRTNRDSSG